jgi:hypothetical protein
MSKPGVDVDGVAETEADHFMKCPSCGEWFDMRDLQQTLAHIHDPEIEICEGPEPPRKGPLQ